MPGARLPVEFIVVDGPQPDSVEVTASSSTQPLAASLNAAGQRWSVDVDVPAGWADSAVVVSASATTDGVTAPSISIAVPVATSLDVIEPDVVDAQRVVALALEFGSGDDQVGIHYPEFEGEVSVPNSVQIDPATGNFVILDSVTRRLLIAAPTGEVVDRIDLSGEGWLDDLVVLGDTGRAMVSEFRAGGGQLEVSAHLARLEDGTATVDGPFVIPPPPTPPIGTELVWNEALDAVFAKVYDPATDRVGYYRLFDTAREELDVSLMPEFWWNARVEQDQAAVGFEYNNAGIFTRLPHGSVGVSNMIVRPDNSTVWSAGTVDWGAEPGAQVHYYLGRTDPACGSSVIAEIEFSALSELGTRSMIADDSGVYVVDIGANYQLLQCQLGSPTCP